MNCKLVPISLEPLRCFREYKFMIVHRAIKKNNNTTLTSRKKKETLSSQFADCNDLYYQM